MYVSVFTVRKYFVITLLNRVPIFENLPEDIISKLANVLEEVIYLYANDLGYL